MSARALRRQLEQAATHESDEKNEIDESLSELNTTPYNAFAAFNEQDDFDGADPAPDVQTAGHVVIDDDGMQNSSAKIRRKRKKKKKIQNDDGNDSVPADAAQNEDDDLDSLIFSFQQSIPGASSLIANSLSGRPTEKQRLKGKKIKVPSWIRLLHTEQKRFNPDVELRALFGTDVLLAEAKEQQIDSRGQSRSRQRKHMRRTILCKPADTWPVAGMGRSGLHMECRRDIDSGLPPEYLIFDFACNEDYADVQDQYLARSSTNDPATVAELLRHHPFHVDTLLQMSQVFCFHGEFVQASDCVSRALFALECAFHSKFDVLKAHCRLDYSTEKNRSFYIAIFRHIQLLGRRGCHRTALEFSKVLLALDPFEDPSCALLFIDYHALRARQYDFVVEFVREIKFKPLCIENNSIGELSESILLMPNFAYSLALAKYYIEVDRSPSQQPDLYDDDLQLCPRTMLRQEISAAQAMQYALVMFPEVVETLLLRASDSDLRKERWKSFIGSRHFKLGKLRREDIGLLDKLVLLFVERSHALWKDPKLLDWLSEQAASVIRKLDSGSPNIDVQAFDAVRMAIYFASSPNRYAKCQLSDFADIIGGAPMDDFGGAMHAQAAIMDDHRGDNILQGRNPFAAFLMSLLPWVNIPPPPPQD